MRRAVAALVIAASLAAPAALAQDRPPILPTRDVVVTYSYTAGSMAGSRATISWVTEARLWRIDFPGAYIVADFAFQDGFMAMDAPRFIMEAPLAQLARVMRDLENARFTRGAADRVAGIDCTIWHYEGSLQSGIDCVTEDGIWLRGQNTIEGEYIAGEAVRVTYGRMNPARYQRPRGYQTMQAPPELQGSVPRR